MTIERVFVAGAGLMGHGIAQVHAAIGKDGRRSTSRTSPAPRPVASGSPATSTGPSPRAGSTAGRPRRDARADPADGGPRRASPTRTSSIEAVFEDLGVKRDLWRDLDARAPPATIFASNTSSIAIHRLAEAVVSPSAASRFVGMHFFSPVPVMPLVELIRGAATLATRPSTAIRELADELGKQVIVSADRPGFIVNRILMPFLAEAMRAFEEGVGHGRGHRRRRAGRAQPPDGPARAGRLHRPRRLPRDHARARRRPRPGAHRARRACSRTSSRPATSARRPGRASTPTRATTGVTA